MGAPLGNKNAAGPHSGGEKSAMRAEALRADIKGHRERKEFTPEYWNKVADLEAMTPKEPEAHCGVYLGSNSSAGSARVCRRPKEHEGDHRSYGKDTV